VKREDNMNAFRQTLPRRLVLAACLAGGLLAATGCSEKWDYRALRDVQADFPRLSDPQWSRKREFSDAELLGIRPGGPQVLLVARASKPPTIGDVAQLDEQVSRSYVIAIDGPIQVGRTYHITPDNGRLIEGTTFRPAWRPYRGLEGDVTILSASASKVDAAVRVSALTLRNTDPERSLSGAHEFKVIQGHDPFLRQSMIRLEGGPPEEPPAEKTR
jgi:hypothetical protein